MTLYLARHGRTSWTGRRYCGRSDPPLDARGREEAAALSRALASSAARARVVCSPLRRAVETAALLRSAAGVDGRLIEVDFGAADGLSYDEVETRWPAIANAIANGEIAVDWPGGERWDAVMARAGSFVADLDRSRDVIAVTHGLFAAAIARVLGADASALAPGASCALSL